MTSQEYQVAFLNDLFSGIISELTTLNKKLEGAALKTFQRIPDNNPNTTSQFINLGYYRTTSVLDFPNPNSHVSDWQFKDLINKCMGDLETVERLIKYELQKDPNLDRRGAIQAAIKRWESDNR